MIQRIKSFLILVFYLAIAAIILGRAPLKKPESDFPSMAALFTGNRLIYRPIGHELEALRPHLPRSGSISFIADQPNQIYDPRIQLLYAAQSYFAPLLISLESNEKMAIVFCSDRLTAEKRLLETGYQWSNMLADGKGVAVKK